MVTEAQRRGPRPWAIALGLIAVAMVPILAVAAMAGSGGASDAEGCEAVAAADRTVVEQAVLDALPGGSTKDLVTSTDYDEACAIGGVETTARWTTIATGASVVFALERQGWTRVDTGSEDPAWLTEDLAPTGTAGATNDNESLNVVLTKLVGGRDLDLAVDQEGLHVVLARG
ncbi:MAG: hypothetical protein ACT4QF_13895 [Sporichthyaceae bacterium]